MGPPLPVSDNLEEYPVLHCCYEKTFCYHCVIAPDCGYHCWHIRLSCRPLSEEEQRANVQSAISCNDLKREVTVLHSLFKQLDKTFTFDKVKPLWTCVCVRVSVFIFFYMIVEI